MKNKDYNDSIRPKNEYKWYSHHYNNDRMITIFDY